MRLRFRFNVAWLLLLITAVALFLGYAESRRRHIVREHRALRSEGVTLQDLSDTWWPESQYAVLITFRPAGPGMVSQHRSRYAVAEAIKRYRDWHARLKSIGVEIVQLSVYGAHGKQELVILDDPDDLADMIE